MEISKLNGFEIRDDKAREQAKTAIDAFNTAEPVINNMSENVNALIRANVIYDERITKAHEKAVEADDAAFNYNKILSERIDNLEKTVNESGVATTVPWQNVTDKPETFNPATHGHTWDEITGKPETYPPENHSHSDYATTEQLNELKEAKVDKAGWTADKYLGTDESGNVVVKDAYSLPAASASVRGGVMVGDGLAVDENGVLSLALANGDEVSY